MGKMVVRLIPYRLLPAGAILLGVGAALAEGMQTFTNEQAAQRHCPADAVVWLNTSSANYHLRSDPWYGRTQRGAYDKSKMNDRSFARLRRPIQGNE
jgi:hypothetical protein